MIMKFSCKLRNIFLILSITMLSCLMCVSARAEVELSYADGCVPVYASASIDAVDTAAVEALDEGLVEYFIDMHRSLAYEIPIYEAGYRISFTKHKDLGYARIYNAPDLFYVDYSYGYSYATVGSNVYLYSIYPEYTMSGTTLERARAEYESMIENISGQAAHLESDLEKALFYHDYIVANYQYDTTYTIYDTYNMLTQGKGVCQAYTLLYTELLNRSGIENVAILSDGLNHAWNALEIDGAWYLADLTWDDPIDEIRGRVYHTFFLCSAGAFDHTLSDGTRDWYSADGRNVTYSDTYDNAFWSGMNKWIHVYDGAAYYLEIDYDMNMTFIYSYDFANGVTTTLFSVRSNGHTASGAYSTYPTLGFCGYGDRLYYAESTAFGTAYVYEYDIDDRTVECVFTYTHTCTASCEWDCSYSLYELFSDGETIYYLESGMYQMQNGTAGSFAVEKYTPALPMDVNGDGEVSNADITALIRYLSGWEDAGFVLAAADINSDGKIGNRDVIALIKHLAA